MKKLTHLLAAALLAFTSAASAEMALFRYQGIDYAGDDLSPQLQQALYDAQLQYYRTLRAIAGEAALDLHEKEGGEDVAKQLQVAPPSEETLKAFYEQNKARINQPFEQIREQLAAFLQSQETQSKRHAALDELRAKRQFTLLMRPPTAPQMDFDTVGYPSKGDEDAKVTVVEFADYQCPHCKQAAGALKKIAAEYENRVRFVYLDFPVNRSGISRLVAHGGVCANEQGRFWEYHDTAFAQQRSLSQQSPRKIAESLELDMGAFDACLASERPAARVQAAQAQGERAGVTGTPSLFVNGRKLEAEHIANDLRRAIEEALSDKG